MEEDNDDDATSQSTICPSLYLKEPFALNYGFRVVSQKDGECTLDMVDREESPTEDIRRISSRV